MTALEQARQYLAQIPVAVSGQGGHKATFRAACVLVRQFALPKEDALTLLREWNRGCQPPWSESDLRYKIISALCTPARDRNGKERGKNRRRANDVKFIPATLQRIAGLLPQADDQFVKDRSPVRPDTQTPATFLHRLYRRDECIIVFDVYKSQGRHVCKCIAPPIDATCLDHLVHGCPNGVWFLANPVDGEFHRIPRHGGKRSRRSQESVTSWRFLVLESDKAEPKPWLAALIQMPLRIAAIYKSGGKSIHALIQVDAASKADWDTLADKLKPIVAVLGADPKTITAVRLTRLPGCHREQHGPPAPRPAVDGDEWKTAPLEFDANGDPIWMVAQNPKPDPATIWTGGKLQELLYLNPEPSNEPICRKPTRQEIHQRWLAEVRGPAEEAIT